MSAKKKKNSPEETAEKADFDITENIGEELKVSVYEEDEEIPTVTKLLESSQAEEETALTVCETVRKPITDKKTLTKQQKRKRTAMKWVLLNLGIIMMSCSVYFFQTPNNFTLGGVAGIAILLANVINHPFFTQAVIMAIINVFLLVLGLIILGKQCTFLTIYCSLFYTGFIWLFEFTDIMGLITGIPTPQGGVAVPLTDQPFLEMCYAILLFGVGGALIFNCGASSGGTDIIALILNKFTKINVGMALMLIDCVVVCVSITAFQSPSTALYSFMGLFAKSFLLDSVIESIGKTKYITIITKCPDEIGKYILEVINHGYTKYDAEGGYTNEKKKVLVTVCKRGEALKLKAKVKELDKQAFVILTDANEILGKGFGDTI